MSTVKLQACLVIAAASSAAALANDRPPTPFEEASIIVEQNATDGDTEVVITGIAGDKGLRRLTIQSPGDRIMTTLIADRRSGSRPSPSTWRRT